MFSKIIYKLYEYSFVIIFNLFFFYLVSYILWLKELSKYFTFLMIFLGGGLLGYVIADKAHRYLKKHYNKSLNK